MDRPDRLGTPRRWAVLALGLVLLVIGVSTSILAGLGVGSWQVFETGLMAATGLPFAPVAIAESLILLVVAWVWLGQPPWAATVILAFAGLPIGWVLDTFSQPDSLLAQTAMLLGSIVLIGLGVAFYLAAALGASAQDAMFVGLYETYSWRPGYVRFGLDFTLVVLGTLLGGQLGIGTLVATIGIPVIIEPALRLGHQLADTPLPVAMRPSG
ncbi:hypothetical protein [Euzebya tangerina]|uniref:hypothetical protein n=1 Tax=Euzebya tangerina TaxID=591198 RepID=UPI0013C3578C|nr:hypothetical protein [Euzebya tangerina]